MSDRQLVDGNPVPADGSHIAINPETGMQRDYVVLTPEERAKGFVKPVRRSYMHKKCGVVTTMGVSIAETYARNPRFYSGTFCVRCRDHLPLTQFLWEPDGEPMEPNEQPAWERNQIEVRRRAKIARRDALKAQFEIIGKQIVELEAELSAEGAS